jgi:signal transduction histidine kinase
MRGSTPTGSHGGGIVRPFTADRLTLAIATGVCLAVILLGWFGYHAVSQWRARSALLAERQSMEAANLLYEALARDMSGVQASVLTSPEWSQFRLEYPNEMNDLIASAFARYPYPDAFFAWEGGGPFVRTVFFYRADQRPGWLPEAASDAVFPVLFQTDVPAAQTLMKRIEQDVRQTRRFSYFEIVLGDRPHQVIAQINYADPYRQRVSAIIGFTVDMRLVREHYFGEFATQMAPLTSGQRDRLIINITDSGGRRVAGTSVDEHSRFTQRREFDLLFLDRHADSRSSRPFTPETWTLFVSSAADAVLFQDASEATVVLTLAGSAALVLAVGLVLVVRAERASSLTSRMRSDFVSAVTHELKTPIATIRTAADTLSKDRLTGMSVQQCSRIVLMEAGRLTRLVENMLAYARIVDAVETYRFAPVAVSAIVNDIQEDFEARLDRLGFELDLRVDPLASDVRGDRTALRLLFGNLVDNAIKYSDTRRVVTIRAGRTGAVVTVAVADQGTGISPTEIGLVTQKFVRGKSARGGGTGLGLSIASRIAADHGGHLRIESTVDVGTTVSVTLPRT